MQKETNFVYQKIRIDILWRGKRLKYLQLVFKIIKKGKKTMCVTMRERERRLAKSCGLKKSQVTYFCTFCHASTTGRPCLSTMPRVFYKERRERRKGDTHHCLATHFYLFKKKILKNLYPRVLFFSFESFL